MLSNIKKNTYVMQILTLMSGTLIAQAIMLLSIPIITRLYTTTEFGLYALFISITNIVGNISSLKYDQAIMLAKREKDEHALLFLSSFITVIISLISFIIILIFDIFIKEYFNGSNIIYLIPIGILLIGLVQIFNAYSSKKQFYKAMAKARSFNAINISVIQISTKYFANFNGLVLGKILADLFTVFYFIRFHWKKNTLQIKSISKRRIEFNIKRHKNFPKYQTGTVFLNSISQNMPILLLGYFYSTEVAGLYALTIRVLQTPVGLIGSSTREVFYQNASKLYINKENFFNLYLKTTISLLKLFIIPTIIIFAFGEDIFRILFGEKWSEAGKYSEILIFWILFLFINSPSIMSFSILGLQKVQMYTEILSVFLRFSSIFIGYYIFNMEILSIVLFTITSILINIYVISYIYIKLKKHSTKNIKLRNNNDCHT